ncbi:MAG: serine/threonine protein kinase [Polyangiales bacterium]
MGSGYRPGVQTSTNVDSIIDTLERTLGDSESFHKTSVPDSLAKPSPLASPPRVELLSMLGEGGMAQVHLARQSTLGRQVAVKMLRPELQSEQMAHRLMQEAWTTGALEHPNIIPVHDITHSADGAPQIVLKRIEGRGWSDLLSGPSRAPLEEQLVS